MNSERLWTPDRALNIPETSLANLEHGLSYAGPGVARLSGAVAPHFLDQLLQEMDDPKAVQWRDAGGTYLNGRGVQIVQNHDVFALKLSDGDQTYVDRVPLMTQLMRESEQFVRSLGHRYPALEHWEADEMSYHSYYDAEVGLSFHRDNLRFNGLIVVIALEGECDFQVIDREPSAWTFDEVTGRNIVTEWTWRSTYTIPTKPGDMVLTRATGLLPEMTAQDNPEHAVMNVRVLPRKSFMVRANSKPHDKGYGFEYQNWGS